MKLETKVSIQQENLSFDFENLKIFFSCLLLIAIVTQGKYDPAPFNLLQPPNGIENWFGLFGSLLGGSLLFVLGQSALLIPLLGIFFSGRGWPGFRVSLFGSLLTVFSINTLIALLLRNDLSLLESLTGLWGVTSALAVENIFLRLMFVSIFLLYLIRFFFNNRFNPRLFFLLSNLGIITFIFLVSSVKVINDFYLWGNKKFNLILNHPIVKNQQRLFSLKNKDQQRKYPLIFYQDLVNPNSKIAGLSTINLGYDDLKRRNTLQKTLAVMDENI